MSTVASQRLEGQRGRRGEDAPLLMTYLVASRGGHVSGCTTGWGFTIVAGGAPGVKLLAEKKEDEEL